jgi:hypothetical protein
LAISWGCNRIFGKGCSQEQCHDRSSQLLMEDEGLKQMLAFASALLCNYRLMQGGCRQLRSPIAVILLT